MVVPGVAPFLAPIEDTIHKHFIPALFDVPSNFVTSKFCICLSHSVKQAGIGLQNPVDGAPYRFDTSKAACKLLVNKIIEGGYLSTHHHSRIVSTARAMHTAARLDREREIVREYEVGKPALEK